MIHVFKTIFPTTRLAMASAAIVAVFLLGFGFHIFFAIGKVLLLLLVGLMIADILLLYRQPHGVKAKRYSPDKMSNGDENPVYYSITNDYQFAVHLVMQDEFPFQFQVRNTAVHFDLAPGEQKEHYIALRPTERGEYHFGKLHLHCRSTLQLFSRQYSFEETKAVPVYPSFLQLKKYELAAFSNRLTEAGIKKIRAIGQHTEFDQIREYVKGDDYRTINWKATARKGELMVNQYQDEKSQQVYCLIDKGRAMKMPFNGLTLLDYAINSSLVMSSVSLNKDDRAGLITFSNRIGTLYKASSKRSQMHYIREALYNQTTRFQESDYERLYRNIKSKVTNRSLMLLYTNFESLVALNRQMRYLRAIARDHMLVVVFFENTEVNAVANRPAKTVEGIYQKTIAEKFVYEKRLIVKELQKYGIQAILTSPQNLTINSINKYLELKARGLI